MFLTKSIIIIIIIIIIRGLTKKQYDVLVDVSSKLNELRNYVVETTKMFKASYGEYYEKTNYIKIINKVKTEFKNKYSILQASVSNAAIKKHVDSFNCFIAFKNKKIDGKYDRNVNKPKKHDEGTLHIYNHPTTAYNFFEKEVGKRLY